jgi:hypothetical protein
MNVLKEFIFFELGMRKPEEIFNLMIKHELILKNFIDDKNRNTDAALHWDFKLEFTSRQRCGTTI